MSNRAMSLVPDLPPSTAKGVSAQRQVLAIQLLLKRKDRLETAMSACKQRHGKLIAETTKTMADVINQTDPAKKDAIERVHDIRASYADVVAARKAKADELAKLMPLLAGTQQSFREVCQESDENSTQAGLDFGDFGEGLHWTHGTLELIDAECQMLLAAKGDGAPGDVAELALAIAGMGISGDKFVTAASDAVETEEAGEDMSGEAGDDEDDGTTVPF